MVPADEDNLASTQLCTLRTGHVGTPTMCLTSLNQLNQKLECPAKPSEEARHIYRIEAE